MMLERCCLPVNFLQIFLLPSPAHKSYGQTITLRVSVFHCATVHKMSKAMEFIIAPKKSEADFVASKLKFHQYHQEFITDSSRIQRDIKGYLKIQAWKVSSENEKVFWKKQLQAVALDCSFFETLLYWEGSLVALGTFHLNTANIMTFWVMSQKAMPQKATQVVFFQCLLFSGCCCI